MAFLSFIESSWLNNIWKCSHTLLLWSCPRASLCYKRKSCYTFIALNLSWVVDTCWPSFLLVISFSDSPQNFLMPLSRLLNHQQMLLHYLTSRIKVVRHEFTQLLTLPLTLYFTYTQFFSFPPFSVEDVFFLTFKTISLPWLLVPASSPLLRPISHSLFYVFMFPFSLLISPLSACLSICHLSMHLSISLCTHVCTYI